MLFFRLMEHFLRFSRDFNFFRLPQRELHLFRQTFLTSMIRPNAWRSSACALALLTLLGCGSHDSSKTIIKQIPSRATGNYQASAEAGLNCGLSGVDVARAVSDAARVVALLCESQNEQMAKDGFQRCPTDMCVYESTITDPANPVLTLTINYTDDLGSGGSSSGGSRGGPPVGPSFPSSGGSSPQRLTVGLSLTIPLGGSRTATKCISPIHPSIFTEIQKQTIEEIRNAKPEFCD